MYKLNIFLWLKVNCNPTDSTLVVVTGPGTFRLMNVLESIWRQWGWNKAENVIMNYYNIVRFNMQVYSLFVLVCDHKLHVVDARSSIAWNKQRHLNDCRKWWAQRELELQRHRRDGNSNDENGRVCLKLLYINY